MRRYAISKKVGRNIRNFRLDKDLTQEDLAEKVGIHVSTLGRIERGESNPSIQSVNKIARSLGIRSKALFN